METYFYAKERRRFGRQCMFGEQNKVLESIMPDKSEMKNFILRDPVHNETQLSKQFALSEMNTENPEYISKGVLHFEGGWPKDVNMLDEEATLRHRKKVERDDQYPIQMNHLLLPMLHLVNQNNAVNLYEDYFESDEPLPPIEKPAGKTIQCFRYPSETYKAPANHISFSPEGGEDMVVAYAKTVYLEPQLADASSYVWRIESPQVPVYKLDCDAAAITIEYNLRDGRVLAGGLSNGKVCIWDSRASGEATQIIQKEEAHRTRVTSLLWLHSKASTEFYSASTDGQIFFWDTRKFTRPIDRLLCDPNTAEDQLLSRSYGVSVLEFEYTIPTKYLIGTEEGFLFFGNRKGATVKEKLPIQMRCNDGPIRSLERNPIFVKFFMTIGEYQVKIFAEECRDNPIIWMRNQEFALTCGCWSRTRCSLLFTGRLDGMVDCWDILTDLRKPVISLKVSTLPICHMRAHENGAWLSCGDTNGDVYMVELSPSLTYSDRNDRALLSAMFERESKREKILEARMREVRLKEKTQMEEEAKQKLIEPRESVKSTTKRSASLIPNVYLRETGKVLTDFLDIVTKEQNKRDRNNPNPYTEKKISSEVSSTK